MGFQPFLSGFVFAFCFHNSCRCRCCCCVIGSAFSNMALMRSKQSTSWKYCCRHICKQLSIVRPTQLLVQFLLRVRCLVSVWLLSLLFVVQAAEIWYVLHFFLPLSSVSYTFRYVSIPVRFNFNNIYYTLLVIQFRYLLVLSCVFVCMKVVGLFFSLSCYRLLLNAFHPVV